MRKPAKWVWAVVALIASHATAVTPDGGGKYGKISQRNVFGLKEPVVTQTTSNAPPAPLPKLVLKGITTILGNKLACLTAQFPAQAGAPPQKEESLMLAEGQREAGIEVLEIDTKASSIKVNNSGTIMPLTFEKPSAATNGHSAPSGIPSPNAAPQPQSRTPLTQPRLPNFRNLRMQGSAPPPVPTLPTTVPAQVQTNTPTQLAAQPQATATGQLTPEEQAVLQELEKAAAPANQTVNQRTVPAQLQRPPTQPQLPQ